MRNDQGGGKPSPYPIRIRSRRTRSSSLTHRAT